MEFSKALALKTCSLISVVVGALLLLMTGIMFSLVITRYFFAYSPPWSEELTGFTMVWMSMLGGSVLTLFDDHIKLGFMAANLGPKGLRVHAILVRILVISTSIVLIYTAWKFTFSMANVRAPGSRIMMWIPISSILVFAVLSTLFQLIRLAQDLFLGPKATADMDAQQAVYMDSTFKMLQEE